MSVLNRNCLQDKVRKRSLSNKKNSKGIKWIKVEKQKELGESKLKNRSD